MVLLNFFEDFPDDDCQPAAAGVSAVALTFGHLRCGFAPAICGKRTADVHLCRELALAVAPHVTLIAFVRLDQRPFAGFRAAARVVC